MKVEVPGLEATACILMFQLDLLLTTEHGRGLFYPGEGVHLHLPTPIPSTGFIKVVIRPIGWPMESLVETKMIHTINGWMICAEGTVICPHLPLFDGLTFMPLDRNLGIQVKPPEEGRATIIKNIGRINRALHHQLRLLRQ